MVCFRLFCIIDVIIDFRIDKNITNIFICLLIISKNNYHLRMNNFSYRNYNIIFCI